MKNFDTRVYSISDFIEWKSNNLLDLSPDFQRRSVWSERAKSYLVDTVIRGKPIPKLIITQDLKDRRNVRRVVDGQQRLRALLEFHDGDFKISRAHNRDFATLRFDDLPAEVKNDFLKYEIGVDLLFQTPYADLLDIFARINTYTVKLNTQEKLNAQYLGYFKISAYQLGYRYVEYFIAAGVLTKAQVSRMGEAELASDLLVSLVEAVQTNKSIENVYRKYEEDADDIETHVTHFDEIMSYVGQIYPAEELANTNWSRIQLFYSLFTAIGHGLYNLQGLNPDLRFAVNSNTVGRIRVCLDEISAKYDTYSEDLDNPDVPIDYREFIDRSRRRTTDTGSRVVRANFICTKLVEAE